MANSLLGGFLQGIGPAIQAQRESALKQKMLDMQMQDYQMKQQEVQAQAAAHAQQRQLIERWKTAPPEERKAIEREISLNQGKIPGQTVAEQMADFQKSGGMGMPGGGGAGGGDNPYAQGMDMAPSFGPKGMTMTGSVRHPSGKQAEVQGLLYSVGADPNNRAALIDASSVINATPEAQYQLMQQFQSKYGGGQSAAPQGGGQQQAPQQKQQQEPGIEAVGPDGQPIMFDNQATMDEYTKRGLPLGPQGGARAPGGQGASSAGGGGSPYDVIRQKDVDAAIRQAGGTAAATQQNTPVEKTTRDELLTVGGYIDILKDLQDTWTPSASGPIQGSATVNTAREKLPISMGGHTDAETAAITKLNIAVGMFQKEQGGQTFTPQELANIQRQMPKQGMGDEQFKARLNTVLGILSDKREKMQNLVTQPRSEIRQSLGGGSKRRVGAGGAGGLTPKAQDYLERITGGQ